MSIELHVLPGSGGACERRETGDGGHPDNDRAATGRSPAAARHLETGNPQGNF